MAGNDWEAGAKSPAPVDATMDCKPAALGAAVHCIIAAQVADTKIGAATVIGYSPDEHVVRWMEISSTGEYHDHRGTWERDMIAFEPLQLHRGRREDYGVLHRRVSITRKTGFEIDFKNSRRGVFP